MEGVSLSKSLFLELAVMICVLGVLGRSVMAQDKSKLTLDYYDKSCPNAQPIVRKEMDCAVRENPRNAAAILRLHFHDCFVQGCDGSVLLEDTATLTGEKTASQNVNSLIGFHLVDRIKTQLEGECPGVVSCADLLAIAARDAVLLVGGPYWDVPVGRLDSKTASLELANIDIPNPNQNLVALISKFISKGLSPQDMVALVGSHTIGMARCLNFRDRIYGDFAATSQPNLGSLAYLNKLQSICPESGHDSKISPMDYVSPNVFDNVFFESLLKGEGLLNSDQEMYSSLVGFETADLVKTYSMDPLIFFKHFSDAMVKMGNITNPEGGEVRTNCRYVNT
ncbi:peroxidase 11-like [Phalaenopsis equestris]|uniref:peroxidase 11-like n=1 Tax=Phalaenopsis equestris TaxID=78828 RepID=UPI0009E32817|nr:peroxidase 11-like [Phalaenopsis equestris]